MKKEKKVNNKIAIQASKREELSIEQIITKAIDNNVPIETMERLLAMRRELKEEYAREAYNTAMANFQAECPAIVKTKEVKTNTGAVAYRYAPIEVIVEQAGPYIQKYGFSYSSSMVLLDSGVRVVIKVTHKDGHSEESPMEVPLGNKTNVMSASQVVAAAQTFAKRYAFCNAFGILTADEDIDGRTEPLESKLPIHKKTPEVVKKQISPRAKIIYLCKTLNILIDENTPDRIRALTSLEYTEKNYPEIINRLEIIVSENKAALKHASNDDITYHEVKP